LQNTHTMPSLPSSDISPSSSFIEHS
jgi:hypothetical protein